METITKESETSIKITEVIPEVIIPEKVEETIVSLTELKTQVELLQRDIILWTSYRDTPLTELAKIDTKIEELNNEKAKVEAYIVEAEKQGIVEKVKPVEPVVDTPVEPVGEIIK